MRISSFLLAIMMVGALMLGGCGEAQQAPLDKDKFDKVAGEQYDLMMKGKFSNADLEKLYKKHGVTKEQVDKCAEVYGEPDSVQKKKQAQLEKMGKGFKAPPPK